MFNLDQAIAEWRRQMAAGGIKIPEALDELESHLRDDIERQMRSGSDAEQAFAAAVQRIGRANILKSEFEKIGGTTWALISKLKSMLAGFVGGRSAVPFPSLDSFDLGATRALALAQSESAHFHHDFIGTEHVLLGVLQLENGIIASILRRFEVDREAVRMEIEKLVGLGAAPATTTGIPYTPRARKALRLAASEAKALNQAYVGTEHIFLGLLLEGGGVAALVLKNLGVDSARTREEILKEAGPAP